MGRTIAIAGGDGTLAGIDFGGHGAPVLLVHGSGHNACAWGDVAQRLVQHGRVIAIDLRGHGQTRLQSSTPEQYWRDLGPVCRALGIQWLVGHSTGGYAICAAAAAGLVTPHALCVVDGFVLKERSAAAAEQAAWSTPESKAQMREKFRYGWVADREAVAAYVEECVEHSDSDWLNAGARPELVREVMYRSFTHDGDRWTRRPTLEEIAAASGPDSNAPQYPSRELYDAISCPIAFVLAKCGFYTEQQDTLDKVVEAAPNRVRIDIDANHNVPMTRPIELANIILGVMNRAAATK